MAGQDVEQDDDGTWKIARKVAPDRVISTVDPEARHMHKSRSEYRDGYKAHIAIEPETGLVTAAALTPANAPDGSTGVVLLADEEPGLQVLGDGAYGSGETLAALGKAKHRRAIKPWPTTAGSARWLRRDDFIVDEHAGTATCPAGHTVSITPGRAPCSGSAVEGVHSESGAPHPRTAGRSTSILTTASSWNPVGRGETATSPRTTDGGDRWSSDPSPGSWPTTTGGSGSEEWRGTNSVSRCASPPSTSGGWSTSGSDHDGEWILGM